MARSTDEWKGKNDDGAIPPRVRLRVFQLHNGKCHCCGRKVLPAEYWQCDHVIALINGGENRESNLSPACRNCCYIKTAEDVGEKSKVADKRKAFLLPKRGTMPGSRGTKYKKLMSGKVVLR